MKKKILFIILIIAFVTPFGFSQNLSDTIKLTPVNVSEITFKKMPTIKNTITIEQIDNISVGDIGNLLRTVPNVSGVRKGGANIDPVIRGFKYSQINTQIDNGIQIENGCPNRMDPASSHIDINDIDKIEVLKGPYSLRFGPNFGGNINFITTEPVLYKKFEAHVKAVQTYETNGGGNKQHITVNGGNQHIFFVLTGNNLNYGNYTDGDGNIVKSSFKKYSYSGKVGYRLSDKHRFMLTYIGSHSKNVLFPALPMDERSDHTKVMAFDYNANDLGKNISFINFKFYRTSVKHIMDNKYRSNSDTMMAVSDVDAINLGGRAEIKLKFKEKFFLLLGTDYLNTDKNGTRTKEMIMQAPKNNDIPEKIESLWNNAHIQNIGLFTEFSTSIKSFDLLATVRGDFNTAGCDKILLYGTGTPPPVLINNDNTSSTFTNLSFNLGATKNFKHDISLSLMIGRGVRSPNMLERFIILLPVGYDNFDYIGNPQLKPETNNEADLTVKYLNDKVGSFELNGFYSYVQDFILGIRLPASSQAPLSMNVLGVKQFANVSNAWFTGFEFGYKTPDKYKFAINATAAYTYAVISEVTKQILDKTKIISQQIVGEEQVSNDAAPEIPPFEANISVLYRFWKNRIIPKASYRLVLDQNHVSSAFYENTTPGFNIFNLSLTYNHNKYFSATAGCNNILDAYYYEHLNRRVIGTTLNLYEPGRNFYISLIFNI
jgi:iron complex outermembrane receptor protein